MFVSGNTTGQIQGRQKFFVKLLTFKGRKKIADMKTYARYIVKKPATNAPVLNGILKLSNVVRG